MPIHSVLEPSWTNFSGRRPAGIPDAFYTWLSDKGSLTKRVMDACSGQFSVRVLHQAWGTPLPSERRLLRLARAEISMIREVELYCGDEPWVFARTLIPASSLTGGARRLARLGDRPLGAVLFADPTTQRRLVQMAKLLPRHPLFGAATDHLSERPTELWGRRTIFRYAGKPILVNEIFLPAVLNT